MFLAEMDNFLRDSTGNEKHIHGIRAACTRLAIVIVAGNFENAETFSSHRCVSGRPQRAVQWVDQPSAHNEATNNSTLQPSCPSYSPTFPMSSRGLITTPTHFAGMHTPRSKTREKACKFGHVRCRRPRFFPFSRYSCLSSQESFPLIGSHPQPGSHVNWCSLWLDLALWLDMWHNMKDLIGCTL